MLFGPEEERQYREFLNARPGMVIDTFKTAPKSAVPGKRQTSDEAPTRKPTQPTKPYTNLKRRSSTEEQPPKKKSKPQYSPRGIASKPTAASKPVTSIVSTACTPSGQFDTPAKVSPTIVLPDVWPVSVPAPSPPALPAPSDVVQVAPELQATAAIQSTLLDQSLTTSPVLPKASGCTDNQRTAPSSPSSQNWRPWERPRAQHSETPFSPSRLSLGEISSSELESVVDLDVAAALPEVPVPVAYQPTSIRTLRLRDCEGSKNKRIYLNIGGKKFETSVSTMSSDPSSLLAGMVEPNSPFKPYYVEDILCYFLDRNPRYFEIILDYLRNINISPVAHLLPSNSFELEAILCEARFYLLGGLEKLVEERLKRRY
ncbi:hypothetical protein SNE40_009832 [Patella caerulea]|uniref:BTB domain-containing protein n=1 Tax=Patella caerulea TaxID=87958 RepID=A0AAN8PS81_PATCE